VGPGDTAPSAAEADAASEAHEETSDEPEERSAEPARAEHDPVVQDEPGDRREEAAVAAEREQAAPEGERCARCGRSGTEGMEGEPFEVVRQRTRTVRSAGSTSWAMKSAAEAATPYPIASIGTTLGRARCPQPASTARMKHSLATHGQLTPLVAATRPQGVELVDGFKRVAAAEMLGWPTLLVATRPLDETGQWAAMLLLNRGPSSMTALEEALVLREMAAMGLLQTEIAALCARHKSWVNRRIGLVDRLHPELLEAMKLGLLHPGSARRLLSLPPGNQLEVAAAVQRARLGPWDTELLVGLWRRTKDPTVRRALLSEPRASLHKQHPERRRSPLDPRLGPEGQRLCRCLHRLSAVMTETSRRLTSAQSATDRAILDEELRSAAAAASRLSTELGSARTSDNGRESDGSGAIS